MEFHKSPEAFRDSISGLNLTTSVILIPFELSAYWFLGLVIFKRKMSTYVREVKGKIH